MVTIRHATKTEVVKALDKTSAAFDGNVVYNRFELVGKNYNVTLKVKDSHGKGARRGFTGRAMPAGCWHVYGTFFDAIFAESPNAVIIAMGKKITKGGGNWIDQNIGSQAQPLMYSDACECVKTGWREIV